MQRAFLARLLICQILGHRGETCFAHRRVTPVPPRLVCAAQAIPPRPTSTHSHLRRRAGSDLGAWGWDAGGRALVAACCTCTAELITMPLDNVKVCRPPAPTRAPPTSAAARRHTRAQPQGLPSSHAVFVNRCAPLSFPPPLPPGFAVMRVASPPHRREAPSSNRALTRRGLHGQGSVVGPHGGLSGGRRHH
jgi:hypothetical protein